MLSADSHAWAHPPYACGCPRRPEVGVRELEFQVVVSLLGVLEGLLGEHKAFVAAESFL